MNQKELTKTFMMISNSKTLWSPWILQKKIVVRTSKLIFIILCLQKQAAITVSEVVVTLWSSVIQMKWPTWVQPFCS